MFYNKIIFLDDLLKYSIYNFRDFFLKKETLLVFLKMVKSILIDDQANKLLENVLDSKGALSNTGLIIGTV